MKEKYTFSAKTSKHISNVCAQAIAYWYPFPGTLNVARRLVKKVLGPVPEAGDTAVFDDRRALVNVAMLNRQAVPEGPGRDYKPFLRARVLAAAAACEGYPIQPKRFAQTFYRACVERDTAQVMRCLEDLRMQVGISRAAASRLFHIYDDIDRRGNRAVRKYQWGGGRGEFIANTYTCRYCYVRWDEDGPQELVTPRFGGDPLVVPELGWCS